MLILLIQNDSTGTNESANYNYEVRINTRTIAKGHIEGHNRDDGWAVLVKKIAEPYEYRADEN
jgi:hypothetical protein